MSANDQVADELEIRGLVARYAIAVSTRDEAAWSETWAEDGVWELFGSPLAGRDTIVNTWRAAMGTFKFVLQLVLGGYVEIDGDTATGCFTMSEIGDSDRAGKMQMVALYHDQYRRVDGSWRFAHRRLQVLYQGPPDLSGQAFPPAVSSG